MDDIDRPVTPEARETANRDIVDAIDRGAREDPLRHYPPHIRGLIIRSMQDPSIPPRPFDPAIEFSMTDASHAERFAEAYGGDVRYDHRRDRWLIYHTHRWKPDNDGQIYRSAIEFARLRQIEVVKSVNDKKQRESAFQYFLRMEAKAAIDRLIFLARNIHPIADTGDTWDLDPWVLGTPTGVLDLKSGLLRDGDPADRITMSTEAVYDHKATCPRWRKFVEEIFDGDAELITFAHRFVGYALTGCVHEQLLAFFHGTGANGKGTFMNTIAYVLGDYAYNMPFSTVELRSRSAIPNDVAALEKRRWVIASETNDGTRLNEARIKALTGSDPITARYLHGEFFTFQPVAKFVLAVNHKPVTQDNSYGFWRRIRLVPFLRAFIGDQRDPTLDNLFRGSEASGILRWAVEGCLDWQEHGLNMPAAIMNATSEYQDESDPLTDFFSACLEPDPGGGILAGELQAAYVKFCDVNRVERSNRMSAKVLGQRLKLKLEMKHTERGIKYMGFRLISNNLF